jgi:hypothetical protein
VGVNTAFPSVRARHESLTREALRDVFRDQEADVVVAGRSLGDEWDAHLAARIFVRNRNLLADVALKVARALKGDYDPDVAEAWLSKNAEVAAASINASTRGSLELIDDKQSVFDALLTAGAARYARSMVTTVANFGAHDAAEKVGGDRTKTWSGGTTRHASMNGQTVRLSENFSNGMAWPGDPAGGAAEVANCGCSVTFN